MKSNLLSVPYTNWPAVTFLPLFPRATKLTGLLSHLRVFLFAAPSAWNGLSRFPKVISFTSFQSQLMFLPQKGLP